MKTIAEPEHQRQEYELLFFFLLYFFIFIHGFQVERLYTHTVQYRYSLNILSLWPQAFLKFSAKNNVSLFFFQKRRVI
jgi:hypothetical protein